MTVRLTFVATCLLTSLAMAAGQPDGQVGAATGRIHQGLVVMYDFADEAGDIVRDRAGTRSPINLQIEDTQQVQRRAGSLEIRGSALIRSVNPARSLTAAIRKSRSITIEAWLQPQTIDQTGPARIITLSQDSSNRNFTLGQDGERFDVRFRSQGTNPNGIPSLASEPGSLTPQLTHVVYTRSRQGMASLFVNGKLASQQESDGDLSNWDNAMRLAIGNELNQSRPWLGTIHLVAIYRRALTPIEIAQNYSAGQDAAGPSPQSLTRDRREVHFELEVAPILASQCLECHDTLAQQGGLDLSRKEAAIAGGDSGKAIIPQNSTASLLWQSIASDEMPHDRAPLSDQEKQTIREWIDDGAVWSLTKIDPAVYVHGGRPDANWLRRLTVPEYIETIRALFDVDISKEAHALLPADLRADGFTNTAYNLTVDLKHIEAYQRLAEIVVQRMDVEAFRRQFKEQILFTDKDMGDLIKKMGSRILRGPLEDREVIAFRGITTTVAATDGGNKEEAIALLIEAMLQSPRFLYRIERQLGDGSPEPVEEFELASRLSYMIWGGPPDDELFTAAADGDLYDEDLLRAQVQRMLDDPRAVRQSERFFTDWLNLGRLDNLQPNREKFPSWNPELARDMKDETVAFIHDVIWKQKRPMSELLNANVTYATPRLAKHYGLPPHAADIANSDGALVRFDLTNTETRGGMLTQGSLLTVGGDEASMVTRGLLVMHELLRGVVKDPPPCVDTTPVPTRPGLSQRMIAEERISNETCGGCHRRFETLAFGLEKFDGLGGYHETDEHGNELRDDGEIMVPGESAKIRFGSSRELMNFLANCDRVKESMTWKLTQFCLGRPPTGADAGMIQRIHLNAQKNGGTYQATVMAIASSELVTMIKTDR